MFVSVVIPTYNRKDMLKNCIKSLFDQTYPKNKYEIVLVDDGSNDNTEDMIIKLQKVSPVQFQYIKQKNKGPAEARNLGIKNANGEIIAFTDDDCIADRDWLKQLIRPFKDNHVKGVAGKVIGIGNIRTPFTHLIENLKGEHHITSNIAYRKNELFNVGLFNKKFQPLEDIELAARIYNKSRIDFSERAIIYHPLSEESLFKHLKIQKDQLYFSMLIGIEHNNLSSPHVVSTLMFYIFIRPFAHLLRWKEYILRHPYELPKFCISRFGVGLYAAYLLVSYKINGGKLND